MGMPLCGALPDSTRSVANFTVSDIEPICGVLLRFACIPYLSIDS